MDDKEFRLCYVSGNILYFTNNFEGQSGDDWDDVPYEHNAGEPYRDSDDCLDHAYRGNIRMVAYYPQWDIKQPCDNYEYNSPFCVDSINKGRQIAWLYNWFTKTGLFAGATLEEAVKWLRDNNTPCGELI